jgi:hypothetical protein
MSDRALSAIAAKLSVKEGDRRMKERRVAQGCLEEGLFVYLELAGDASIKRLHEKFVAKGMCKESTLPRGYAVEIARAARVSVGAYILETVFSEDMAAEILDVLGFGKDTASRGPFAHVGDPPRMALYTALEHALFYAGYSAIVRRFGSKELRGMFPALALVLGKKKSAYVHELLKPCIPTAEAVVQEPNPAPATLPPSSEPPAKKSKEGDIPTIPAAPQLV